ncbi:transglycosylase domain-containing protein [Neomegalonema sp.]|uniref:transglycosylase domain-containing protein n=1 Tax=Neomegalonema sp. TaxID=2039713 RepID=UPI00261D0F1E|nr:transglycosylase domain-containing protein [Neomegalonema sp.]MDD2869848.1 transglycosylase domain-containing protein [Neomegalonema sp.]
MPRTPADAPSHPPLEGRPAPARDPARRSGGRLSFAAAFGRGLLGLGLICGAVGVGIVAAYRADLPSAARALAAPPPQGLRLQDARGKEYVWIDAPETRVLGLQEASPDLARVLAAVEPRLWAGSVESGVSRALAQGLGAVRAAQPQAAREDDSQPQRLIRSLAAQWRYDAAERQRLMLNRALFAEGIRGFDAAGRRWFNRPAARLDLAQAAALAGALEAPAGADPFADPEAVRRRTARALDLLAEAGLASSQEISTARAFPARLSVAAPPGPDPVFISWALDQAPAEARAPGVDADLRTTLDLRLQHAMDQAFETVMEAVPGLDPRAEAAAVLLSRDGAVRAMAGGRRVGDSGVRNRATTLKRPIGLLFAPFAATASIAKDGGGAATVAALLRPGARPAEVNKAALTLPYAELRKVTRAFGFDVEPPAHGKTAMGVRATVLQVAGALATLADEGFAVTPFGVVEALGPGETPQAPRRTIFRRAPPVLGTRIRAAPDQATRLTIQALAARSQADALARRALPPGREALAMGAETGDDVWFMGATADFICVLWIGRDDGTPASGAAATLAADLWREIMTEAYAALPIPPRPAPGLRTQDSRYAAAAPDWRPSTQWPNYGADQK